MKISHLLVELQNSSFLTEHLFLDHKTKLEKLIGLVLGSKNTNIDFQTSYLSINIFDNIIIEMVQDNAKWQESCIG